MLYEQLMGNLIQGLILGGIYGMATMGLSLIFGTLKVVNVGHGQFIMVGAFITLWMFTALGIDPVLAVPAAFLAGMLLGLLCYYTFIRRLREGPAFASLLATFSVGILLEETARLIFGSEFRGYNWSLGKVRIPFTVIPYTKLIAFSGSVVIALLLYLWFRKSRAGTALRSVVEDSLGARVCGVNVDRQYAVSFALGVGLTVASGALITMFIPVGISPTMGGQYTLKAFVIAVLGGLASPYEIGRAHV
jgi:branched-chain amino acid transport system permease protein